MAAHASDTVWSDTVWYVAYGSNMKRDRLGAYLEGSGASGPYGVHPGARDPRPPERDEAVRVPHEVYFAGGSRRWGGAVAFLALTPVEAVSWCRAYLLRWEQVADVAAQENGLSRLDVGDLPAPRTHTDLATEGQYNALLRLDDHDGLPAVTITTSRALRRGTPSSAYAAVIREGLSELTDVPQPEVSRYLATLF